MLRTLGLIIPLIILGGAVLIGLAPRPLTFTVLGLLLSVGFATLLLWADWRWYRFGLRRTDRGLLPLAQSLVYGVGGVLFAGEMINALLSSAFTNPPIATACLCTRVGGLATAGWYDVGLLVEPGLIAMGILLIVEAVARTGFALVAARERLRRR